MDEFEKELEGLLNRHSIDAKCHTPDYILAIHIRKHLESIAELTEENARWHGWRVE